MSPTNDSQEPVLESARLSSVTTLPAPLQLDDMSSMLDPAHQDTTQRDAVAIAPKGAPDCTFRSYDGGVAFNVHRAVIMAASSNAFGALLIQEHAYIQIPEKTAVLSVLIDAIYNAPAENYKATFEILAMAVDCMPHYGLEPGRLISPSTSMFAALGAHASMHPLDLYSLAAHHRLHPLAVTASGYLLSFDLQQLSNEATLRMGAKYLNKLFLLRSMRLKRLREIIVVPPPGHGASDTCEPDVAQQNWRYAAFCVMNDARSDLTQEMLIAEMTPLLSSISCSVCEEMYMQRLSEVAEEWGSVKATI